MFSAIGSSFFLLALSVQLLAGSVAQADVLGGEAPCPWCECEDEARCPYLYVFPNGALSLTEGNLQERHRVSRLNSADGTSLDFSLIYNTYDADASRGARVNTVLGFGWTHSYNVFLFFQANFLFRMDGFGRVTRYQQGPDGVFHPTEGYFETVVRNPDLSFTLTRKDQTVFNFAQIPGTAFPEFLQGATVYRLTSVVDRNHAATTFSYDNGNLTTIRDHYGRTLTLGSNSQHQLTSVTDPLGHITTFAYDATGLELAEITDPRGLFTRYHYNDHNQLTDKTDSDGRPFFYDYQDNKPVSIRDGDGDTLVSLTNFERWAIDLDLLRTEYLHQYVPCATGQTDGRGNLWTTQYDAHGYITEIITPDTFLTTYTYDDPTLMVSSVTNGNGFTTRYDYDSLGNRTRITDAAGQVTTMTYDPMFSELTSRTGPTGRTITFSYDPNGNLIRRTDPLNDAWTYTYVNGTDLVESVTDPIGTITRTEYDGFGNETARIEAAGTPDEYIYRSTYDELGELTSVTDPNGNTSRYEYDQVGHQISTSSPLGRTTRTTYDQFGNVTSVTDPSGQINVYQYDRLNRLVLTLEAGGGTTTRSYDLNNNLLTLTDEDGRVTQQAYDAENRPISRTDSTGRTTQWAYDADNNIVSSTDARGAVTSMAYDALDRLISVTDPLGSVISATLDPYGNPITVHDARGFVYTEAYDDRDLLIGLTDPLGNTTGFTYNPVAKLDTKTDARGDTTRYQYDDREFPMRVNYPGGNRIDFTFDAAGRMTRIATTQTAYSYTYNADDDLTAVTNDMTGETIRYDYDARRQRTAMVDPDGLVTTYAYDERALVTRINRNGTDEARFTYDPAGQVVQRVDGNGTVTEYSYTGPNQLDLIQAKKSDGSIFFRQSFERDGNYNLTRMEQQLTMPNGTHQTNFLHYIYDGLDRLVEEERRAADDTTVLSRTDYTYDPSGNRTRQVRDGTTTTYDYNSANELLTETIGSRVITYAYDANGNLLTETADGQTVSYGYDHENRLIAIDGPGVSAAYLLSPDGRRLAKSVNGVVTTYLYDGLNVIKESGAGQTTKYLYGPGADENILKEATGDRFYYQRGNVNSVLELTNSSQDVVNTYDYAAFGESVLAIEGTYNPYRFTGRRLESESPHYDYRERLYSSRTGRFLSLAPKRPDGARTMEFGRTPRFARAKGYSYLLDGQLSLGLDQRDLLNGYLYVGNNPTNRRDPTGEGAGGNPGATRPFGATLPAWQLRP